jgi:hypothetical protein
MKICKKTYFDPETFEVAFEKGKSYDWIWYDDTKTNFHVISNIGNYYFDSFVGIYLDIFYTKYELRKIKLESL